MHDGELLKLINAGSPVAIASGSLSANGIDLSPTPTADIRRITELAQALLNAGMDVDTLLARMMGLE